MLLSLLLLVVLLLNRNSFQAKLAYPALTRAQWSWAPPVDENPESQIEVEICCGGSFQPSRLHPGTRSPCWPRSCKHRNRGNGGGTECDIQAAVLPSQDTERLPVLKCDDCRNHPRKRSPFYRNFRIKSRGTHCTGVLFCCVLMVGLGLIHVFYLHSKVGVGVICECDGMVTSAVRYALAGRPKNGSCASDWLLVSESRCIGGVKY